MKNISGIILIVIAAGSFLLHSCGTSTQANTSKTEKLNVRISKIQEVEQAKVFSYSGKLESKQHSVLSTRIMGNVVDILVKPGQKVSKDQVLLQISDKDILSKKSQVKAAQMAAEAAFLNAEKDYNRFKVLFEQNSASQKEMDDMTANYEMAKARLEAANQMKNQVNAQLSYSNISAPFSGVVTGKFINKGDMASPGMPLMSVEAPGKFQVIAMVPESEITQVKNGSEVNVTIKSTGEVVKGKVTEVSTSAKNTGGQYLVKVILDKTEAKLLSGMFTSVQFPVAKASSNNILIPTSALVKRGELVGVYVVSSSNTALLRWLRLGKTFGDKIEVLSGLSADEKFILSSEEKLINGAKLNIQ
jgi:RND family efflux transporter MFP subunit